MKKNILLFLTYFLLSVCLYAQTINKVEYFFDTDPGFGNGVDVPVTPATTLTNFNFSVPLTSVSEGFHILYVRARDNNNRWGETVYRVFMKQTTPALPPAANINKIEYFIDTDPGYGSGVDVPITSALSLSNFSFAINVSAVSAGAHRLHVRSRDANGRWSEVVRRDFTVVAPCASASILPTTLPNPTVGIAYSQTLSQTGVTGTVTWSLNGSSLPAGLSLNTSTGAITGTPTALGTFTFSVSAGNGTCSVVQNYTLVVSCPTITLSPTTLPNGNVGLAYSQTFTQTGLTGTIAWTVSSGNIPNGLTLNSSTGALSGTPLFAGTYTYSIRASNGTCSTELSYTHIIGSQPSLFYSLSSTFAGSGSYSFSNGTGTSASFANPQNGVRNAAGDLFVIDRDNHAIRRITSAGVVTTFAGGGTGSFGLSGYTDATGTSARFFNLYALAIDASGNLYVADTDNNRIRVVSPAGVVSTLAGSGVPGNTDGTGTGASFNYPTGIAIDGAGNLYVADAGSSRIRKIVIATATVSTFAGSTSGFADATGVAAQFNTPLGVTCDATNNVYVADFNNQRIRRITPAGVVTTLAGNALQGSVDAVGTNASFNNPEGISIDAQGNLYVADFFNRKIRRVTPTGAVTSLAGSTQGYIDGAGASTQFNAPTGSIVDAQGNLFVLDRNINLVRKVVFNLVGFNGTQSTASAAQNFTLSATALTGSATITAPAGYEVSLSVGVVVMVHLSV